MKIYKYDSYEDYVKAQEEANVRKIRNVWVRKSTITKIHSIVPFASSILCHGTRNAAEQKYFKSLYPSAEIYGTEISHTASKFPMTVQMDFHNEKEEWLEKFDIVYSNSFDHSYDPRKCLNTWKNQVREGGNMFIEMMSGKDNRSKRSDPLEISEEEFVKLLAEIDMKVLSKFNTEEKNSILYRISK